MPAPDMTPRDENSAKRLLSQGAKIASLMIDDNPNPADLWTVASATIAVLLAGFENGDEQQACVDKLALEAVNLSRILDKPTSGAGSEPAS